MSASVVISICGGSHFHEGEAFADDGVLDVGDLLHVLQPGVLEVDAGGEGPVTLTNTYLSIAAEMRKPPCFAVVGGQVGSPSPEGDPQGAARQHHGRSPFYRASRSQPLSRMYLTVFRMLSAMVSRGRHPRLRIRSHFRKMKGLSPIHPCEPPVYVRNGRDAQLVGDDADRVVDLDVLVRAEVEDVDLLLALLHRRP